MNVELEFEAAQISEDTRMQLEDYFDFLGPDDIRIRGTRIGIETILYEHLHQSRSPDAIARRYPSLTLEQVHATLTYYLRNEKELRAYLARWLEHSRTMRDQQAKSPSEAISHLRELKARREAASSAPGE